MSGVGMIDVPSIVDQLMTAQRKKLNTLQNSQKTQTTKLNFFDTAKKLFSDLQASMTNVSNALKTVGYKATSSDTTKFSASVTSNSMVAGDHTVVISKLALAQTNKSGVFTSKTSGLGLSGTLTFTSGSSTFDVAVTSGTSLADVVSAINSSSSNFGVSASIVTSTANDNTTPQYSLMLSGKNTGSSNAYTITGSAAASFSFTSTQAAQNAEFTFDGLNEVRASNTVTDVIDGLSLNLVAAGTATLSITQDSAARSTSASNAINDFLKKYNGIMSYLDSGSLVEFEYQDSDGKTKIQSSLVTQAPLLKSAIQKAMNSVIAGSGGINTLADLGIKLSKYQEFTRPVSGSKYTTTGALEVDSSLYKDTNLTKFDNAINNNFNAVSDFFTKATTGFLATVNTAINDTILSPVSGTVTNGQDAANAEITALKNKITDESARLLTVQDKLFVKYSDLNAQLTKFDSISKALTTQLSYLENLGKK